MAHRILVVEDEEPIARLVAFNLQKAGFDVAVVGGGPEALEETRGRRPDGIILDLMLPGMDGLEVCRRLRRDHPLLPILMLTARDEECDKVVGLEMGADDYITKPFSPRELVARVRAVLRRAAHAAEQEAPDRIHLGDLTIDRTGREVTVETKPIALTAREYKLLEFLARHAGQVFSREQLLSQVWGYDYPGDARVVDVHIRHLREKIEPDPGQPRFIKTVRGVGYKVERKP